MHKTETQTAPRCRTPLPRREDLDPEHRKLFDYFTSDKQHVLRGLNGPAGLWLLDPKLVEVYLPFGTYLRYRAGLSATLREACILATARECDSAFEWAAHEPEALRIGVPADVVAAIKFRRPTEPLEPPYGTVVALVREAFTEHSVTSTTYQAAVSLLGVPLVVDLITLAGMYASTSALLATFDMQLDPGETHLLPSLA
jgi:4-carboxymuconolactone decarboxylase